MNDELIDFFAGLALLGLVGSGKLKLEITTNGFTKILTITDVDGLKIN